ncbi:MAG: hypothetical protein IJZ68_05225 [Bacteroidaceae bacterium]|nr:hypothetical protein [Bacteroidaceae bacterium]
MKKILGLDLGTNSIGWALINVDENENPIHIEGMGSRIIPMGSDKIDYEKGASITKNADRRTKRSSRRMGKRYKMRRNKLLFILDKLEMLPEQFRLKNGFPEANKLQDLELLPIAKKTIQLDSLNHYELRAKALNEKIGLKELGSVLYQYNRLRGYSGGGDDNEEKKKDDSNEEDDGLKDYEKFTEKVTIKSVIRLDDTFKVSRGKDKGKEFPLYEVIVLRDDDSVICGTTKLQNLIERVDSEFEFEITVTRKKKNEKISFALPQKTNWRKQMEDTENTLKERKYYPCQLFVEELRKNKWSKIRNRVILRQQYMREFDAVWEEQSKYYPFLNDCPRNLLQEILEYIFPGQSESQKQLREKGLQEGLKYVIKEQVIYYQRPLKLQTELINNCQFEKEEKVIPTSHPLFQVFRCWDQINRLYITSKQNVWNERKHKTVLKYSNRYLTDEQKKTIYNRLQIQKQLSFNEVARIVNLKSDNSEYLNGLHVKAKLLGCETAIIINKVLGEFAIKDLSVIANVWQSIYDNVHEGSEYDEKSKRVQSIIEALPSNIGRGKRTELALRLAQKVRFVRKYANLSQKAIENILPVMCLHSQNIPTRIKENFDKIKHLINTGEIIDENLLQDYIVNFIKDNPFALEQGGLMYAFAASLVYGRHTMETVKPQITNYRDIKYVKRDFRNPVVEQIVNETMQVIKAIWKQYNLNPNELEIRVELARDLKNSAKEREKIYKGQNKNQNINDSIKKRLLELNQEINDRNINLYKIWSTQEYLFDENMNPVSRPKYKDEKSPTLEEIEKMRLWEEQHYVDPYTLKPIPLSKLFSREYDIDHIIPKSRYFDDSIANKVVCKSVINEEKDNRTAWEYISSQNSSIGVCSLEKYLHNINATFGGQKKKNLLTEKIPSNPVARQLKDTQYISVAVKNELAKIVGSENVKTTTGSVTDYLRSHWGLKKMFMELTEPRFKQMELWNLDDTGKPKERWVEKKYDKEKGKNIYEIKGWSKRYDHRHHAVDALVVALSNEKFIKRLNELNKYFQDELEKHKDSLNLFGAESLEEAFFSLEKEKRDKIMRSMESSRKFEIPMANLVSDVRNYLETMVVSQKTKDKLSIKEEEEYTNGVIVRKGRKQLKIRGALHQDTYYGRTNNRDTKVVHISKLQSKDIDKIIDNVLREEIISHKKNYASMKDAFTGEGLIEFNESRFQTKDKLTLKPPVYKVKLMYSKKNAEESTLQQLYKNNSKKSVITGDNYLFVVMCVGRKRIFDIASLYDSVSLATGLLKDGVDDIRLIKNEICENIRMLDRYDKKGNIKPKPDKVLFYLQQNDLVYMPKNEDDDILNLSVVELKKWLLDSENKKDFASRVYKVVKFSGTNCFFIPNNYAREISVPKMLTDEEIKVIKEKYSDAKTRKSYMNYVEFGTNINCSLQEVVLSKDKLESKEKSEQKSTKGKIRKIQDYCVKIKVDRLGNIIEFNGLEL